MPDVNYNYLDFLNPQQRAAVEYKNGPSLIIAGAGSGKTRVLTYKIVDLLMNGFEPYRIMALTFTNKAAREMKERILPLVGAKISSRLWMGTFHSIFLRILRSHYEAIGFKPGFTIYDTSDTKSLIKLIVKELLLDDKIYKPATLLNIISNAKNAMMSPDQYLQQKDLIESDKRAKRPMTGRIYKLYMERCHIANAMDFDDILYYMNILLRDNPDIRRHYQEFFRYILVDEYQDTNFAQHLIISQLVGDNNKLCVVGDDAQSIYSFRGANINNIINLEKRYPGLRIFKLERNYRSTQNIVNAASSLIAKNTYQLKKNVYSENETGDPIEIVRTYSDIEEAYLVATKISQSVLKNHDSLEEYAILYRTNAQSRVLEEALRKRNINYRIYGGLSFYQRKEIKDIIAYFRLTINPDDDEALRRIINFPARGIGETTMKKIQACATDNLTSIWQIISNLQDYDININTGTQKKISAFSDLIKLFIADNEHSNAFELGQLIYNRTGILTNLAHENTPESISKQENLSELLSGLKDFVESKTEQEENPDISMRAFLSEVMLATDQDEKDEDDEPKVTLMTAHAAKGLEFPHIYIVGVEEELFPSSMSMDSIAQIEEERRLLYVAITRAKTTCTITFAGSRFRNGQTMFTRPSRFLSEIDPKYLKTISSVDIDDHSKERFINPLSNFNTQNTYRKLGNTYGSVDTQKRQNNASHIDYIKTSNSRISKITPNRNQSNSKPMHNIHELAIGQKIEHPKLGIGEITGIGNIQGEPSITVDFGIVGVKKLLLKFAKFDLIN